MSVTFYPNYCHYKGYDKAAEPSVTGETYVSSGLETTGAAYDLFDSRRSTLLTIDTLSQTTTPVIDIDLTADITAADFLIFDNHNFKTADATFKIRSGASTDYQYISKAYSGILGTALTEETVTSYYVMTPTDGICLVLFDSAHTITDNNFDPIFAFGTTSYDANITIGELAIGVKFSPTFSPNINSPEGYVDGSALNESDGGKRYGYRKAAARKTWKLTWDYMSAANKTSLETVFAVTSGMKYPFWIDLGETASTTPTLHFVRFMSNRLEFIKKTVNAYGISFDIEEEL